VSTPLRHRDGFDSCDDPEPAERDHDGPLPPAAHNRPCDDPWQQPTTTEEPLVNQQPTGLIRGIAYALPLSLAIWAGLAAAAVAVIR
jgi:hypothetical protein